MARDEQRFRVDIQRLQAQITLLFAETAVQYENAAFAFTEEDHKEIRRYLREQAFYLLPFLKEDQDSGKVK